MTCEGAMVFGYGAGIAVTLILRWILDKFFEKR